MVAQVVEAPCYKPEGHGFSTQWCQWNFSLTKFLCPHYGPQVNSASNRIEFQEYFLEDKGCRCWRPYHLHVLIVLKFGVLGHLEPSGPVQGLLYLLLLSTSVVLHQSIVEEFLLWSSVLDLHWSVISGVIKQPKLLSLLKLYCVYMHVPLLSSGTSVIYVVCVCCCCCCCCLRALWQINHRKIIEFDYLKMVILRDVCLHVLPQKQGNSSIITIRWVKT